MTNSIIILTAISTNWFPMEFKTANPDGTQTGKILEIGILCSNKFASLDGKQNTFLISQELFPVHGFLARDPSNSTVTNFICPDAMNLEKQ